MRFCTSWFLTLRKCGMIIPTPGISIQWNLYHQSKSEVNRTPPLLTLLELWKLTQSSPLRIVFKSAVLMVAVQKQIQGSSSHLKSDFQYELIGLHPPFVTKYRYNTRRCFLSTFKVCTPSQCLIHFQLQWLGVGRKSWWPVGSTGVHD